MKYLATKLKLFLESLFLAHIVICFVEGSILITNLRVPTKANIINKCDCIVALWAQLETTKVQRAVKHARTTPELRL